VAQAVDPVTGVAIPSEGQAHPRQPELVALPPELHAVGLADKRSGVLLASRSLFYNVRVRYQKRPASDFGLQAAGTANASSPPAVAEALSPKPEAPAGA
jgi:hypothetical protein